MHVLGWKAGVQDPHLYFTYWPSAETPLHLPRIQPQAALLQKLILCQLVYSMHALSARRAAPGFRIEGL